ncbi:MAG: hypothetical protein V4441_02770 [Pseudomonadota bacterium]
MARRFLLSFLGVIFLLGTITFVIVEPLAPQFSGNVSFDEKIKFLRDRWGALEASASNEKLTLVIGSSMALNNLNTDILSGELRRPFLNLGVWGMRTEDAQTLALQVADRLPVRAIILSTQFFEMRDEALTHFAIPDDVLSSYLRDGHLLGGIGSRDFYKALRLRRNWTKAYSAPHAYTNVMFNNSGAVPLDINADQRDPSRWLPDQVFPTICVHCMDEIETTCRVVKARGIGFSVVLPPLAHWVRDKRPEVGALYEKRKIRLAAALKACQVPLFVADERADFDDSCFADFSHLNREGMREMSDMVASWLGGRQDSPRRRISCRPMP